MPITNEMRKRLEQLGDMRAYAERDGIPLRTLADVRADLEAAKRTKADAALARVMLRHGRLTAEAAAWIRARYGR